MNSIELTLTENKSTGICETCIKCDDCQLHLNPAEPIYECEQFDAGRSVEFDNDSGMLSREPLKVAHSQNGGLKGVCSDCSEHESCVRGQHTGGIWDCDSYMEINR